MTSNTVDYEKYLSLVKKNKRLYIFSSLTIMTVVTLTAYLLPSVYEAKSTVFIEKSVIAELVKGLAVTPSIDDKLRALTYALNSRTLVAKTVDELDLNKSAKTEETLIKSLQKNTTIQVKDREGLFIISFKDRSPKVARDYVNALVRRYIDENTSSKREESYGATKFFSEQLSVFREKLEKSEKAANAFKSGPGSIANMDPSLLLKDINDSQLRLDDLRIKQTQLETALAGMSRASTVQSNLPAMQKRLQELQLQYTDSYPEIIRLKDDIRNLEEQLKSGQGQGAGKPLDSPEYAKLSSELKAIRQAEANLSSSIARNRGLLQSVPAARATLENLEREKSSQQSLYEAMLAREGQSEVSKQMEVQDKSTVFRIVDPAILPIKPISPDRVRIILLGILAGIGGGFGLVLLKDQMESSIKDVDVFKQLGLPVLAVIPRIEDPQQSILVAKQDRWLYIAAGCYFSLILVLLIFEIAEISVISNLFNRLYS